MTPRFSPSLFTIPVHRAFADALVAGVMRQYADAAQSDGLLSLPAGLILLPNNRAVTAVRDAFIRHSGGAMLLPRLAALGDDDIDDNVGAALDRIEPDEDMLPPAIAPMQRRFLLARLIADLRADTPVGEAVRLADALARVFDALAIEDIPLNRLERIQDAAPLPRHWEDAVRLLRQLARCWPNELASLGLVDRSVRRNSLYARLADRWRVRGLPSRFVVAAGITTTAPAIARLLKVIALSPGGTVVLPHFDTTMPDDWWDELGEDPAGDADAKRPALDSHPHLHLKILLDRMDMRREDVQIWPDASSFDGPEHRSALVGNLFAPARFTATWQDVPPRLRKVDGISQVECATPAEEAQTIALAMREMLEQPGKTAALVTPDRSIAMRVAGHLARWGIIADDSAGQPLATTRAGELALSLAAAVAGHFPPVELIALLSHPAILAGDDGTRRLWMDRVRELDLVLRGPRPAAGLAKLDALLAERAAEASRNPVEQANRERLLLWWRHDVMPLLSPLAEAFDQPHTAVMPAMLAMLRRGLSLLSQDMVWTGADGRALAALLEEVEAQAALIELPVDRRELVPLLRQLMRDVAVRPPQGGHPRLFIWGLIEGRLQRADRMILAGLNEGQWPQKPSPDPWLPPVVRRSLGLAGLDRPSGLSAHDFASALGASQVIITRSQREGTAPTVASRLLLRLTALVGADLKSGPAQAAAAVARALDVCTDPQPVARPSFTPTPDQRPKRLSVTEVDTLLADPFAFYARNALGLHRLDPLDAEPTAAWRGTMVHAVLERWLKDSNGNSDAILPLIEDLLNKPGVSPVLRALWAPRLRPPLQWAAEATVSAKRDEGRYPLPDASEARRSITVEGVTLSGSPDRIDRLADGGLAIVDYKSGSGPSAKSVEALFALQLGLLGLMAERGAFTKQVEQVNTFEYWRMNRAGKGPRKGRFGWCDSPFLADSKDPQVRAETFVGLAHDRLVSAIKRWLNGEDRFTAKLEPDYALYADYDHLMRLEEWYGREGQAPKDRPDA